MINHKKGFRGILAMVLALAVLSTSVFAVQPLDEGNARSSGTRVPYWDVDSNDYYYIDNPTQVAAGDGTWNAGWYLATGDVTIGSRVAVSGDVHLILADDCELTVTGGIQVHEGNSLTIYAQSTEADTMGVLIADATTTGGAGIGSNRGSKSGTITINGGNVTATGGSTSFDAGGLGQQTSGGAGIGSGGGKAESGQITINGGNVVATGSDGSYGAGAGIGGGGDSSHATYIEITGGTITATAGDNGAAGIGGGGHDGELKSITITGGDITATGTYRHNEPGNGNANAIGGGAGRAAADMRPFQNCVIRDGASQTVVFCGENGAFTLTENYEIETGWTLRIQEQTHFVITDGATLTNNGTFVHSGTLENNGTIDGNGTVIHVVGQRTSIDTEEHEGTCGCGETIREAHEYSTVVENDSFVMDCGQCDAERTISVSEVVQTPSIYEDGQTAKLSVAVTASDNNAIFGLSYQWQKESAVTSVAPSSIDERDHDIEASYTVPEDGGTIAFQATGPTNFYYSLHGLIHESESVSVPGNETKTIWFTDLPGGSYRLEIMVFGGEGIEVSFDSQPYKPYVAIPEATASEYILPSYQSGDKYRVQVTLGGQTLTKDYTLPSSVEITGVTAANGTYDGQAHAGYTGTPAAAGHSGEFEVSYQKKLADGSYTDLANAPTAVGTYRVKFSFVGDGIYGTKTLEFSVGKADSTLVLSADSGSVGYNDTTTFTVTENTSGGVLSVTSSDETVATAVLDGNTITVSGKKVGTATITVTSAGTDNYNGATAQYEVTVSQDSNAWLTQPAITDWTAGDTANAPTYEAKYGNDTVVVEYKKADAADDTYTTTVPTAAGTYKVRVSVAATTDYAGLSTELDLTIQARRSGGGSGGSGSSTTTTTQKNPDGSTTTTTTNKTTGVVTETIKMADGTTGTVVTDKTGKVTGGSAKVPGSAAEEAKKSGAAVTLPVEVEAADDAKDAVKIEIDVPTGGAKVEIPVEVVTPGTVAIIVHADGTEEVIRTSTVTETGVVITLEKDAEIKIVEASVDFADVVPSSTFTDAIDFVSARGLMNGVGDGTSFGGNGTATRAMIWTILGRGAGEDLYGTGVFAKAGAWAVENGISDGSNPNGNITRQQFAVMLWRMAGEPLSSYDISAFSDYRNVSGYAEIALRWAVEHGILTGNNGSLNPGGNATRNHIAAMYMRYVNAMNP